LQKASWGGQIVEFVNWRTSRHY